MTIGVQEHRRLGRGAIAGEASDRAEDIQKDAAAVLPAPLGIELIWQT